MKKAYIVLLFIGIVGKAQTGIGTTTPEASAKLDISSTNKGLLPPRITLTSRTDNSTIPSPATGLLVYNTGSNPNLVAGYYYWNGSSWVSAMVGQDHTGGGGGGSSSGRRDDSGDRRDGDRRDSRDGGGVDVRTAGVEARPE